MPDFDTLESLNRALEELQTQRQRLFERERMIAIQRLQSFVDMYAIQPQELGFGRTVAPSTGGAWRPGAPRGSQRYVDPATGRSWAGRGARPAWLREALRAGKKLEDFLVTSDSTPFHIPSAARVPAPSAPFQARGTLYRDPVTQQTWGGRGAHPAWLRAAIASGHSKQDFLVGGSPLEGAPAAPDLSAQQAAMPATPAAADPSAAVPARPGPKAKRARQVQPLPARSPGPRARAAETKPAR